MKRIALCLMLGLLVPMVANAQFVDPEVKVVLLASMPSYGGCADPQYAFMNEGVCEDLLSYDTSGTPYVWVIVSRNDGWPDGIGAAQFGIEYDAAVAAWTLCTGGSEIPVDDWPQSGAGLAATWAGGCYDVDENDDGMTTIGWFTINREGI